METLVLLPNGHEWKIEHDQRMTLEEMQMLVGGYIELTFVRDIDRKGDVKHMIVNEDGLLKRLPINAEASRLRGHSIVGVALVLLDWNPK